MTDWLLDQILRDDYDTGELERMARTIPIPGSVSESLRQLEREGIVKLVGGKWRKVAERKQSGMLF